jgi:acyl-CoA reductase-like NAD-dependent aldehyde dehydrogenase
MWTFDKLFIGGEWRTPQGRAFAEVVNPTNEQVIGRVVQGTREDVDQAVRAARAALPAWKLTPAAERGRLMLRIADLMDEHADELAEMIVSELGSPIAMTKQYMVGFPANTIRFYARLLSEGKHTFEERIGNSLIVKEPRGVVAMITPWNYPIHQITAKLGPALAAGCTVIVKPANDAIISCFRFAELVAQAGLPQGVFNFLAGDGPEVGGALASHPEVDMVSFTGSTQVGRDIMAQASRTVKAVSLELGGKAANLVLDDADPSVVSAGVQHAYVNAGQTCAAWTRMLVPRSWRDDVIARVKKAVEANIELGDPRVLPSPGRTRLGPLVSQRQHERVLSLIQRGIDEGATLVTGGPTRPAGFERGYFVAPTVFADVTPEMEIAQQEIFGPVLTIHSYESEDDAVRIANGTIYGLGGAIWSSDPERALRVGRRIDTGTLDINGGLFNQLAPLGGVKQSGIGRELGVYGLEEYLVPKSFQLPIDGQMAHYLKPA